MIKVYELPKPHEGPWTMFFFYLKSVVAYWMRPVGIKTKAQWILHSIFFGITQEPELFT